MHYLRLHFGLLEDGLQDGGQHINRVRVLEATALGLQKYPAGQWGGRAELSLAVSEWYGFKQSQVHQVHCPHACHLGERRPKGGHDNNIGIIAAASCSAVAASGLGRGPWLVPQGAGAPAPGGEGGGRLGNTGRSDRSGRSMSTMDLYHFDEIGL